MYAFLNVQWLIYSCCQTLRCISGWWEKKTQLRLANKKREPKHVIILKYSGLFTKHKANCHTIIQCTTLSSHNAGEYDNADESWEKIFAKQNHKRLLSRRHISSQMNYIFKWLSWRDKFQSSKIYLLYTFSCFQMKYILTEITGYFNSNIMPQNKNQWY